MVAFTDTPDWRNWKRKQDHIFIVELDTDPPVTNMLMGCESTPIHSSIKAHNIQIQKQQPKSQLNHTFTCESSRDKYSNDSKEISSIREQRKEIEMLIRFLVPGIVTFVLLSIALILIPWLFFTALHGVGASEVCTSPECSAAGELLKRTMDLNADPCEDFYQFSCGNWNMSRTSSTYLDHTTLIRERILESLRQTTNAIETNSNDEPEPSVIKEMKIFYDSCQQHDVDSVSLDTLRNLIANLIRENDTLGQSLGRIRRLTGQSYIVDLSVGPDLKEPRRNRVFIDQPELALPKQILLRESGEEEYANQIWSSLSQVWPYVYVDSPIDEINETARQILELETELAQAMTNEDDQTKPGMYNLVPLDVLNDLFLKRQALEDPELESMTPSMKTPIKLNWTEYISETFSNIRQNVNGNFIVDVKDVHFIRKLAAIVSRSSVARLKNYLRWQLLFTFGNDFIHNQKVLQTPPSSSHQSGNAFLRRPFSATKIHDKQKEIECITLLDSLIPFALTYTAIKKEYFKNENIDQAKDILKNIVLSFQEMVASSTWMEAGTKLKAIKKAARVRPFIGYPKWLSDPQKLDDYYEGLHFSTPDDFLQNMFTALSWISKKNLQNLNKPVDTTWSSTGDSPADVDCFYDDELNSITIPLGFLQPPFIGMGLRALDYGALGFFMGHELIHGFDTEGRYSDEYGRLSSWWTPQTLENFNRKTHCIQEQYNKFHVSEINATVNGKQTLKENIADNGGLDIAWRAYEMFKGGNDAQLKKLPGLENYSTDHLFFLAFAQSWCSYVSPKTLHDMVNSNEHSPPKFRVIGAAQNLDAFNQVWQCSNKSQMNPPNKCLLW